MQLIEGEAKSSEHFAFLLNELQKMVLNERHNVLKQLVDSTISEYSKTRDTPNLIRSATSYVMMICFREHKLFAEFFDLQLTLKRSKTFENALGFRNRVPSFTAMTSMTTKPSPSKLKPIGVSGSGAGDRAHSEEFTTPQSPSATPVGTKYTYLGKEGGAAATSMAKEGDDFNVISGGKRIGMLIKDLCHLLYSYLRPFVIQTSSMQTLCDVIHILQGEIQEHIRMSTRTPRISDHSSTDENTGGFPATHLAGTAGAGGTSSVADSAVDSSIPEFDRTVGRIIEDAQERLVFRTQIHLRDEVQNYEVTEDDLKYYAMLKNIYSDPDPNPVADGDGDNANDNVEDKGADRNGDDNEEQKEKATTTSSPSNSLKAVVSRYQDWSPILERTLSVLSKVYPVLNHSVFEFLAYEAVSCCVSSLVELARRLAAKSSSVHGHLFLIKHLLILREQISPFDVDFSITETTLDFGHMTQYLGDLVSSNKYSLVEVFQHTIPVVTKHQLNSKKSMESVLKKACEAFIETQTNLMIGPLIALIAKYKQQTAVARLKRRRSTLQSQKRIHPLGGAQKGDDPKEQSSSSASKEQEENGSTDAEGSKHNVSGKAAIAKKEENVNDHGMSEQQRETLLNELNATLESFRQTLLVRIRELMETMKLYLQNALTQRILLKPIISNVQSAFIQLRKIVIETGLQHRVHLDICDAVSDQLQSIINKSSR